MRGLNKVQLIGNLGDEPDLRYTDSGTAVCNMSVAINDSYKDNDGNLVEQTEWVDVVAWGRLGEVCNEYLSKGSQVYFEGKLQTREWADSDGNDRYSTEVKAQEMMFLDSNRDGQGGGQGPQMQRQDPSRGTPQAQGSASGNGRDDTFEPDDGDALPF